MSGKKQPTAKKLERLNPAMIRFVHLYLGHEDGKCFNNATMSYIHAYDLDPDVSKRDGKYPPHYNTARQEGYKLLTKPHIRAYMDELLLKAGFSAENVKKRYAQLAGQNKDLSIALTSNDRIAKITGIVKDDAKVVDLPQIVALTETVRALLTPPSKK